MQRYYGDQAMNEQLAEIESDLIFKQQLNLAEHNIYGSRRLGVKRDTSQLHFSRFTASSIDTITGNIVKDSILYQMVGEADSTNTQRVLGYKSYELSNHLGNVLAVISDKRIYLGDTTISGDTFALWDAHITSAQDYYPFGMLMPNRFYSDTALTNEAILTVTQYEKLRYEHHFDSTTEAWVGQSGGTVSQNNGQLVVTADNQWEAAAYYFDTEPSANYKLQVDIDFGDCDSIKVEIFGASPYSVIGSYSLIADGLSNYNFTASTASTRLKVSRMDKNGQSIQGFYINHVILKEVRDTNYNDTIQLASGNGYRYGFQGQERDDELKELGNSVNYKYRMHDPRLGRFFAVDPLSGKYPHYTPYSFSGNKVIHRVGLEGLEDAKFNLPSQDLNIRLLDENRIDHITLEEFIEIHKVRGIVGASGLVLYTGGIAIAYYGTTAVLGYIAKEGAE